MTDIIECNGRRFQVDIVPDEDHGAPWDECDGHGPVSDWTRRAKMPGELVLVQDRGLYRYYDFAEACRIARADGWDAKPYNTGQETRRQQAAKAARADYEYLRQWCNDVWSYVGVVVTAECPCCENFSGASASLWGFEDSDRDYLREVAEELISEIEHEREAA
jgi:hypothetical protein